MGGLIKVIKELSRVSARTTVAFPDVASLWLDLLKIWGTDPDLENPHEDNDSVDGEARNPDEQMHRVLEADKGKRNGQR